MQVLRKEIGRKTYKGKIIIARFLGPDLLGEVDGVELSGFYLNTEAVYAAGERYIDDEEKEKNKDQPAKRKKK